MHIEVVPLPPRRPAGLSPSWLAHAPHRLMFFIGASNVLLAMLWWALWLLAVRFGLWTPPALSIPPGWLHAFLMQYLVLPSFVFGFLLTTFPRWMGLPELQRWHYVPVGLGLMGGQLAILLGAAGLEVGLTVGLWMALAGWSAALAILGRLLADEKGRTWHARSCFAGLVLGWLGVAMFLAFVLGAPADWAFASIKLGGFGLLLPVYVTVAHRMFPFFAGNSVPGYQAWRPLWWLGAVWALAMVHLGLELVHGYAWLWLADAPLLALTGYAVWRWWPRRSGGSGVGCRTTSSCSARRWPASWRRVRHSRWCRTIRSACRRCWRVLPPSGRCSASRSTVRASSWWRPLAKRWQVSLAGVNSARRSVSRRARSVVRC